MPIIYDQSELLRLKKIVVEKFSENNWLELGLITGALNLVKGHSRLLRSLSWNDEDYAGNALDVLTGIIAQSPANLSKITKYVDEHFPGEEIFISAKPSPKRITFSPSVFEIPEAPIEDRLVAVMMPFAAEFQPVYAAIKTACEDAAFTCKRADDIWENSILIQDIFSLIFTSRIVVSDFTHRNPNVMYETGIAHTLGKTVIPITQNEKDIPFDIAHHRVLPYLPNNEGFAKLQANLTKKLKSL